MTTFPNFPEIAALAALGIKKISFEVRIITAAGKTRAIIELIDRERSPEHTETFLGEYIKARTALTQYFEKNSPFPEKRQVTFNIEARPEEENQITLM